MNKEELRSRKKAKENIIEYNYMVKDGYEELNKYEKKIKSVHDNGFEFTISPLIIPFDCFGKWEFVHNSINCHTCRIYLTQDENIEDYLSEARKIIADKLQEDIKEIEKSLQLVMK